MPKVRSLLAQVYPVALLLCGFCVSAQGQESLSVIYTDIDETFTNTHTSEEQRDGIREGVYQTRLELFRVQKTDLLPRDIVTREKILLESLPDSVVISLADHRRLEEYFAKSATNAGSSFEQFTLTDGTTIYPSLYYLDNNFSYKFFRGGKVNNLLETYKMSEEKIANLDPKKFAMFGVAYPHLILSLTPNPENPDVPLLTGGAHTAGGFPDHHVEELLDYVAEQHGIKNRHGFDWNSLALSEHSELSYFQILAEEKWKKIKETLDNLEKTPIGEEALERRHPYDPEKKARIHYFAFLEDNVAVYNYLVDIIRRGVANQQYRNVKVGLMCAATNEDWEKLIQPRNALGGLYRNTIFVPDGTSREMTTEEFLGEALVYRDQKAQKKFEKEIQKKFKPSCQLAFGLE